MREVELLERFKNKLIEEYGYDEQDIQIEVKLDELIRDNIRYIPDIVVYKNHKPYIVIELKANYSYSVFSKAHETVFIASRTIEAPYFALASNDYMEAYKIINNDSVSIADIPTEIENFKTEVKYESINENELQYILSQIKDILWSGGKRDDFTIITEINKVLLAKKFDEKNDNSLFKGYKNLSFHEYSQIKDRLNELFKDANNTYKIFHTADKLELNQKEIEIIIRLLERIELSKIENFEEIFYHIFVNSIKSEVLLSQNILNTIAGILENDFMHTPTLCAGSGFGQLPLKSDFKDTIYSIENNQIKHQTHMVLQIIKNFDEINYLDDFLETDKLKEGSFSRIISVPPINVKNKSYHQYKKNQDLSTLFIERSHEILEENGLLYIVLSDSLLSNAVFSDTRDFIKYYFEIIAIISLPRNSLINTNIKCSLLILRKTRKAIKNSDVLMLEIGINTEIDYISHISSHIERQVESALTIKKDALEHRWDYHYFKPEFLKIEYMIKNRREGFLRDYVDSIRGSNLVNNEFGTLNLITAGTIKDSFIDKNKLSKVTQEDYEKNRRGIVQENDLLINVVGRTPKCSIVTKEFIGANTNSSVVILRPQNNHSNEIREFLNSNVGQRLIERRIIYTTTTPIITQFELENIPVDITNYDELLNEIEEISKIPLFRNEDKETYDEDNTIYDEDENSNQIMSFEGIEGKVFSLDVIRTFISLGDLKDFKTDKQKFQREIDKEHKDELVDFLTHKNYKFFPEIVVGLENIKMLKEKKLVTIVENKNTVTLNFNVINNSQDDIFDHIKILDGRHRIESIKSYLEENSSKKSLTISIVFILLNENDSDSLADRAIFYNLNAKAKHLLPDDYLNLLDSDDHDKLNELGILNISLFKFLSKYRESIFKIRNDDRLVLKQCIDLTDYIVKHIGIDKLEQIKSQEDILKVLKLVNENLISDYNIELKTKLYKVVIYIISNVSADIQMIYEYVKKDMSGFIEWLNISGLMNSLIDVDDLKDFYKTYQKTYVPKSRKIYISMPYHKETEWTYFLIKDVINEISNNLQIKIEPVRTDQQNNGVHAGISETVYNEIESCDLMIADLTGGNANVFNEVGFKMGLDKAQALKETQIIFIVNSKCYYEEYLENESFIDNEYKVNGKVLKNNSKPVPFNLRGIKHIEFHNSHYLKAELYKELEKYFSYYKITKVSK